MNGTHLVPQDIGIATFLMLLWKQSFGTSQDDASSTPPDEPWRTWGRPPGGFLDLGYDQVAFMYYTPTHYGVMAGVVTDC